MKGTTKPLSMFIQIMEILFVVIALLAVFFQLTEFDYAMVTILGTKEADNLMQGVLSADCITETASDGYAIRGLFSQSKINTEKSRNPNNPSCLNYPSGMYITFDGYAESLGNNGITGDKSVEYPAALKTTGGEVIPIKVKVYVE